MNDTVVLGIDGGGSKTLIAVADRTGRVLHLARGRPASPLDDRAWQDVLATQLRPLLQEANLGGVAAALPAYGEVEEISFTPSTEVIASSTGSTTSVSMISGDAPS